MQITEPVVNVGIDGLTIQTIKWIRDGHRRLYLKLKSTQEHFGRYKGLFNLGWFDMNRLIFHFTPNLKYHFKESLTVAIIDSLKNANISSSAGVQWDSLR